MVAAGWPVRSEVVRGFGRGAIVLRLGFVAIPKGWAAWRLNERAPFRPGALTRRIMYPLPGRTSMRRLHRHTTLQPGSRPCLPEQPGLCPSRRSLVPCCGGDRSKCGNSSLHTRAGLSRGTQCSGSGVSNDARGAAAPVGLVQCRRGRTAEQREPVVDPLSGQALVSAGPLVPSPAPRA